MNQKLFDYIAAAPTAYHAVSHTAKLLREANYTELTEGSDWNLQPGQGYYVCRNGSSLLAFRMPRTDFSGFMMTAAHSDSPCFKIKENAELPGQYTVRLSTEKYGGLICSTWMDRPLSIAGRVLVRTETGMQSRLIDFRTPCAIIPNVAIHMNRKVNDGYAYDLAVDMLPLYGGEAGSFRAQVARLADCAEDAILATDLYLYNPQPGVQWGDYISAPRLDDLQCAYAALAAFLAAPEAKNLPVYCLFDNEEVGSCTKQGAESTFLADTLQRICAACGVTLTQKLAASFMISCDNGHAMHPNHPEYADKNHAIHMNQGVCIKFNANQRYTSDAVSAGLFRLLCQQTDVPVQNYCNRADMAGGSTLGNISNTKVSVNTVDIGLPQLAMHSSFETAGSRDTAYLVRVLQHFFGVCLTPTADGGYRVD